MNWKFWQRPKLNLDYGRIEDIEVAWSLAYEEQAAIHKQERLKLKEAQQLEDDQWVGCLLDDTFKTGLKPAQLQSRPGRLYTGPIDKYGYETSESRNSRGGYFVTDSFDLYLPDGCRTYVQRINGNLLEQCILEFGHKGDHSLGENIQLEVAAQVDPIIVHESVGEINSKEDLVEMVEAIKKQDEVSRQRRKEKIKKIKSLSRYFD